MNRVIRIVAMLLLVAFLLFCVYGFMTTFEPMDRSVQITWRIVYGVAGASAFAGIVRLAQHVATELGITRQQKEGAL